MTNVLITGANRGASLVPMSDAANLTGLGRGFTEAFLARPNHTVIAAVRDPSAASFSSLPVATGTRLVVVKTDSTSATDAFEAVKTLQDDGITKLDIVIANAATNKINERVDAIKRAGDDGCWLTAFVVDPGFIQTDMGQVGADFLGIEKPPVLVKDAVAGILKMVDRASRTTEEGTHGFFRYTGERIMF
ncbi:hypothetical protein GE09DRAFT_1295088 [Coniochaeta sp. 2T2.1]|nr:hypothetical protein GE09DRAFT_1295088 [Coniochaeta sp. 2T2.1]